VSAVNGEAARTASATRTDRWQVAEGLVYDAPVRILTFGAIAACAASLTWLHSPGGVASAASAEVQAPAAEAIFLDIGVTDDNGRAVTTLQPQDVRVTLDGERRPVVSLRFVYRGPGAETAARLADPARAAPAAAERTRSVLMLVDENAVYRGQQKPLVAVVSRMLDELGTSDRIAVATLPRPPGGLMLTADPAQRQSALARVEGRAVTEAQAFAQAPPQPLTDATDPSVAASSGDPDEQARLEREREAALGGRGRQEGEGDDGRPAAASARALRAIIDGLASLQGFKTVVVFRQAEWMKDAAVPNPLQDTTSAVLASAARARVVVHLVVVGQRDRTRNVRDDEMSAIAAGSGGTITVAKNASDSKAFARIRAALGGGYLVEVEGRAGDSASRLHTVKIESARSKTTVRASALWAARPDPVPAVVVAVPAITPAVAPPVNTPPAAASPPPAAPPARRPTVDDPQLAIILARLSEFLAVYVRDFGNVVAEEDYYQRLVRGGTGPNTTRHLKSDLLLVMTNAEAGWTQYRDVFEVDGRLVRDREARVQKLFLENPTDAWRQARDISDEGARYNIGTVFRNINTPTLPLEYLSPNRVGGLSFWRDGEDTIAGVRAVRLAFEETARPTLVQPDNTRADAPANGTFWVDPLNGRIVKTRISVTAGRAEMTTTVVYKPASRLGLWVPSEMDERYSTPTQEIEGRAVYRDFRSFNVTTETKIK
jgi:VWFA-related protein